MATVRPPASFLTLPSEIRLSIYRRLFDGQLLHIRDGDRVQVEYWEWVEGPPKELAIYRDRKKGLNIMFTSRQCLQEARPVRFDTATFDIDVKSLTCSAGTLQGFKLHGLPRVRSARITLLAPFDCLSLYGAAALQVLPRLAKLERVLAGQHHCYTVTRSRMPNPQSITMTSDELEGKGVIRAFGELAVSDFLFEEGLNAGFNHVKTASSGSDQGVYMEFLCAELISRMLWVEKVVVVVEKGQLEPHSKLTRGSKFAMPDHSVPEVLKVLGVDEGKTD
ncbi:hypothetical protein LTS15_010118 [Exophiala xenobiotica]|nr:hypothetical protein LTS15_010118 [Exophiala xenobiotica]